MNGERSGMVQVGSLRFCTAAEVAAVLDVVDADLGRNLDRSLAVTVEAVAQIKVKSDPESIKTSAEQFLTKTDAEREGLRAVLKEWTRRSSSLREFAAEGRFFWQKSIHAEQGEHSGCLITPWRSDWC